MIHKIRKLRCQLVCEECSLRYIINQSNANNNFIYNIWVNATYMYKTSTIKMHSLFIKYSLLLFLWFCLHSTTAVWNSEMNSHRRKKWTKNIYDYLMFVCFRYNNNNNNDLKKKKHSNSMQMQTNEKNTSIICY